MGKHTLGKRYRVGRTIGQGGFGKVKYGVDMVTGDPVAIKIAWKRPVFQRSMYGPMATEIEVLKRIHQRNVVQLRHILLGRFKLYVIFEYVQGGELFHLLASKGRFTEDEARSFFHQLIEGVEYCHSVGVFHRDLKPENLLVEKNGTLKITDFGLSVMRGDDDEEVYREDCGTPQYAAPEVISVREAGSPGYPGAPVDVWSCGVVLFVMLAGYLPFNDVSLPTLIEKIKGSNFKFPRWFSPGARDLLDHMLQADPAKRSTIGQIKAHEWFQVNFTPSALPPLQREQRSDNLFEEILDSVDEEAEDAGNGTHRTAKAPPDQRQPTVKNLRLNAFALVSLSGALNISPLLERDGPLERNPLRPNHLTTTASPETAVQRLQEELAKMRFVSQLHPSGHKLETQSEVSSLQMRISLIGMASTILIVDFMRTNGDELEFHAACKMLQERLDDLRPSKSRATQQQGDT